MDSDIERMCNEAGCRHAVHPSTKYCAIHEPTFTPNPGTTCATVGCHIQVFNTPHCVLHTPKPVVPGSRAFVAVTMEKVFEECRRLRDAGQKEYAHDDDNAFANFDDDAAAFGISREVDLLIFANKHWRGVRAWAMGHKSQREDARGRINDLIVYLCLLRSMADMPSDAG